MPQTATKPSSASRGSVSRSSQISSEDCEQRRRAQRFRARHQPAPRDAVGEQAGGNGEQDERQRQRGLQQAGLAFADAEQQHRDDRGRRQRDLLGRLRGEIGPGEAVEGRGQLIVSEFRHDGFLCVVIRNMGAQAVRTHPLPDKGFPEKEGKGGTRKRFIFALDRASMRLVEAWVDRRKTHSSASATGKEHIDPQRNGEDT